MIKLIKADFFKLKKEPIFWLFVISCIVSAMYVLLHWSTSNMASLERIINPLMLIIGFFIAIFVSIFVGRERSEGVIRNKIIVRS